MAGGLTVRITKTLWPDLVEVRGGNHPFGIGICTKWAKRAGLRGPGWYVARLLRKQPRWHAVWVEVGPVYDGWLALTARTLGAVAHFPVAWGAAVGYVKPGIYYVTLRRIPKAEWPTEEVSNAVH